MNDTGPSFGSREAWVFSTWVDTSDVRLPDTRRVSCLVSCTATYSQKRKPRTSIHHNSFRSAWLTLPPDDDLCQRCLTRQEPNAAVKSVVGGGEKGVQFGG